MNRRDVIVAGGTGAVVSLAGCTKRVTGWSSLTISLRNELDQSVRLLVTIKVNDSQAFTRRINLGANANKDLEASLDIPWDATLTFRATRPPTDEVATDQWMASIPLWGGNKCMIEPAIQVDSESIQLGPICVG